MTTEHAEQAAFVAQVLYEFGSRSDFIRPLFFSVPNGMVIGGRNRFALMEKYRAEGFLKGISDILYLQPRGEYNCLAIEMKAPGRKALSGHGLTEEQMLFQIALKEVGGRPWVCYGAEEAIGVFREYMDLEVK